MQLWAGLGSRRLVCPSQPSWRRLARNFATTPALQRTSRRAKKLEFKKNQLKETAEPRAESYKQKLLTRDFPGIVTTQLRSLKDDEPPNQSAEDLDAWKKFERRVLNACMLDDSASKNKASPLREIKRTLQQAFVKRGNIGLKRELEFIRYAHELNVKFSEPSLDQQKQIADLRFPVEWYPQARATQRTIHLHVGPTNSGKTYHALKRLEASKNGFYAGPLRLLAQEVYHRFQSSGIACSLVTGDEVKIPEGQKPEIVSNTVEMVSLGRACEVGVIDEIQMIADPHRGWAWTRAVLGSRAKELHLCGETRAVPLIRELAALTGDKLEIHRYQRLNPLKVMNESLKRDWSKLEKGDCVVAFSRVAIHALKAEIEKFTGRRVAIVYGGLPAEIRTQQASLFNDPDNDYDFLVASDAIGMGLNLSCKRIIFETIVKRIAGGLVRLSVPEIKQIGGRAGRYRSAAQQNSDGNQGKGDNVGYVTSIEEVDLPYIREAMTVEPPPITAAGLNPSDSHFEKFAAYFPPNVSLEYTIKRLWEVSQVHPLFFMCDYRTLVENAEVIDAVSGMQIADQITFMAAPIHGRDSEGREVAVAFAQCVAEHSNGRLLDIPGLNLEILEEPVSGNKDYLRRLESLHQSVILYSWLSFRFGGIFTDRTLAFHVKQLVEERMVRALTEFSANKKLQKNASLLRQIALQKQLREQQHLLGEAESGDSEKSEEQPSVSEEIDELNMSDSEETPEFDLDLPAGEIFEAPPAPKVYTTNNPSDSEESVELDLGLLTGETYEPPPVPKAHTTSNKPSDSEESAQIDLDLPAGETHEPPPVQKHANKPSDV
ncbi:P-loop containing nucleoside triphosphate hydrolase protein [Aspergillus carlsbadensis]|nr:P-loop containing nucleoside triphosphate hydrolase protein [Aspergillus carlsbadensis]